MNDKKWAIIKQCSVPNRTLFDVILLTTGVSVGLASDFSCGISRVFKNELAENAAFVISSGK